LPELKSWRDHHRRSAWEDPGTRDRERQQAEALGLRFVNIPVSGWEPPSNEQVAQFLSLFRGDRKEKIFVHCDLR